MKYAAITLICICLLSVAALADDKFDPDLYLVKKIFIGDMGTSDEASRFKLLLDDALSQKGFIVVDKEVDADAVLSGALSVRVYDDHSAARATCILKAKDGKRLWSGNFTPDALVFKRKDPVQRRAEAIADNLHDAWKKAAKAAGH